MLSQRMKRDNLKTGVGVCVPVQTGKCPRNKRLKKFNSHSMQLNINDLYCNLIFAFVGHIFFFLMRIKLVLIITANTGFH